jgi:predicted transcriptional regulator
MGKVVISFKIDSKLKNRLQRLAQEENRSLSNYVTTVLLQHLKAKDTKNKPKK